MLAVIILLSALSAASLAAGIPALRLLKIDTGRIPLPLVMLVGLIAMSLYVQVAYIFMPIGLYAWLLFTGVVAWLHIQLRTFPILIEIIQRIPLQLKQLPLRMVLFMAVLITCGIINLMLRPGAFDTGTYHLQAIKWAEYYPLVPGLVNISCQFGFNSSWFLLHAFTGLSFTGINSVYVLNLFLLLLFVSYMLPTSSGSAPDGASHFLRLYRWLNLAICVPLIFFKYAGEVSPDFPVILLTQWVLLLALELACSSDNYPARLILFVIPVYLLTIKISSMPVCLFALLQLPYLIKQHLGRATLTGIIALVPWFYTNVILSGYLLFPLTFTNLHTDWSYPEEMAKVVTERINGWARSPYVDSHVIYQMPFPEWVKVWFEGLRPFNILLLFACSSMFLLCLFSIGKIRTKLTSRLQSHILYLMSILIAGIAFWFLTAPDFRFAYGYFIPVICMLMTLLLTVYAPAVHEWLTKAAYWLPTAAIPLLLTISGLIIFRKAPVLDSSVWMHPLSYQAAYHQKIPLGSITLTYSNADEKCWDLYFPCTCEWYEGLEARGNEVTDGFRIKPSAVPASSTQPDR
jgi:hypothetical protein